MINRRLTCIIFPFSAIGPIFFLLDDEGRLILTTFELLTRELLRLILLMLFDIGITVVCLGIEYLQIGFVKFSGTLSNFLVEHSIGFLGSI